MNYVLVFRQEIGKELKEIYPWYENQKLGLGDDFLSCVDHLHPKQDIVLAYQVRQYTEFALG
jgi:hypothetical protein